MRFNLRPYVLGCAKPVYRLPYVPYAHDLRAKVGWVAAHRVNPRFEIMVESAWLKALG